MSNSLVYSMKCARVKKRVYMPQVADEYNSSSQPLNAVVLASILSMMSPSCNSKKLRQGYVVDLAREGGVSPCALMLGLLYIKRLSQTNPDYISLVSPRHLFLVSMVVASKYMNDEGEMEALTNSDWAKLGSMTKTALDNLERNFLSAIDWKLYVPLEEYYSFVNSIEARIALDQGSRRGWFTYTDLAAMWEASDLQYSMMLATKQTAKVTTKGAALYLMCVATLFAASGTLPLTLDPTTGLQLSSSSPAVGGPLPQAGNYLDHASPPAPLSQPHIYASVDSAPPNFEQMEILHQKKVPDRPVMYSNVMSNESQCSRSFMCGIGANPVPCYVMGGRNQSVVDKEKILVSDFGTKFFESNNSNTSAQNDVASPSSTATMDSLDCNGITKKTWPKFEDGLFLLLNLVASIRVSSSTSLPPRGSSNPLSHTHSGPNQSSTFGTFKSSTPPSTHNNMDSETTGLSTVQLVEHPSCHNCQRNVIRNATAHWWDGSSDSSLRTFPVESTAAVEQTRNPSHHNLSLDLGASGRGNLNTMLYYSYGEAAAVETTTIPNCMRTSTYSESENIISSPKLNSGQLAVDLHWQSGGTDHSYVHRSNSTPLDFVAPGKLTKAKFTITENLLLYANSLLIMAF